MAAAEVVKCREEGLRSLLMELIWRGTDIIMRSAKWFAKGSAGLRGCLVIGVIT
jgi:hypothetical protein